MSFPSARRAAAPRKMPVPRRAASGLWRDDAPPCSLGAIPPTASPTRPEAPMRTFPRLLPLLAAAALAACAEQGTLEPRREGVLAASTKAAAQITVMTRNMYVGA